MTDRRFINHQNLNDRGLLVSVDCRFCRLVQKYDKYAHIAPCGCAGPTRYVHRQCLEKWIVVKFQHVYNHSHNGDPEQFNIFCEVCQQRMEMEFVTTNKLSKYQDFIEKIIEKKILFSTLLLLMAGLIVAIIVFAIYISKSGSNIPPKYIFGEGICCFAAVIVIVAFIWNFMIVKSIVVEYMADNKNPMIMGLQANLDSVQDEQQEGEEKDPYFGVQATKKDPQIDKSLMLQSKRDSGSVVSKTFTDLVMQKMYKHDEPSQKGRSQKQFNESKLNKISRYSKREPVRQMKDQQVQISNLDKKNQQIQYTQIEKGDKSVQNGVNQLDQEIQRSLYLKNQSIQPSNNQKDVSIQPSFLPKMRRIFKEDTSVIPVSSVVEKNNKPKPLVPKKVDKRFISEYQQNIELPIYKKPTPRQPQLVSSGDSKKSEQQFIKPKKASPETKLKLKTSKDPIKIRVLF